MAAPMVVNLFRKQRFGFVWKVSTQQQSKRYLKYMNPNQNILKLHDRKILQNIYPEDKSLELYQKLIGKPQCLYCGFDPTADSLHIGNLLAIIALLHGQRAGHEVIAMIGGATALIGDPSGKSKEREPLSVESVERNSHQLQENLHRIFSNHEKYFWKEKKELPPYKLLDNALWYGKRNVIEFLSKVGRHFRMGTMLGRDSVKSRLSSQEGMCLTEFTYQMFQAYDWLHLYQNYNCNIQIGGNDQIGNIMTGQDLIRKVTRKSCYGLTVPLVKTLTGDKLGKTDGNAVWLNSDKTSPFELYQFYINRRDDEVETYLKQFTFIADDDLDDLMRKHKECAHLRKAQKVLAEQVTKLVHGEEGVTSAINCTEALFNGSAESLADLSEKELKTLFKNMPSCSLILEAGTTVIDMLMKAKCVGREDDARHIISTGGLRVNNQRVNEADYVLIPGQHILPNHYTLVRVGKKNYHLIKWVAAGL